MYSLLLMEALVRPKVQVFFDRATSTCSYLVSDPATKAAAVIDPVLDYEPNAGRLAVRSADAILEAVETDGLRLLYVLETHAHADHLSAGDYIRGRTAAKLAIGAHIVQVQKTLIPLFEIDDVVADGQVFDHLLNEGDILPLGDLTIGVLHTPGHTPADVSYRIGDAVFVGDTLFMPDYGTARADFPGGDAHALYRSIRKLLALPEDIRVFVGHDYLPSGRNEYRWETSVAEQRAANVHVREGVTEEDFVAMRQARDKTLPAPTLFLPSLQVNIRGGRLPPASDTGRVFLKLPVTRV